MLLSSGYCYVWVRYKIAQGWQTRSILCFLLYYCLIHILLRKTNLLEVLVSNRRYHIHLIGIISDHDQMIDSLALFFEQRAFFTYDLKEVNVKSANYSRRCIDNCDYVIMLIGDHYGKRNNTGVSQMHLSYINAQTKNKPLLILRKVHVDKSGLSRQLLNFVRVVEQQNIGQIQYFDAKTNIEQLLDFPFQQLQAEHHATGWVKAGRNHDTKTHSKNSSKNSPDTKPSDKPVEETKAVITNTPAPKKPVSAKKPSTSKVVDQKILGTFAVSSVSADDSIAVNFTAHAYEGGNLSDVSLMVNLVWRDIVETLVSQKMQFTITGIQRCVNDVINRQALQIVKQLMPNVHAIARTQIAKSDLLNIQAQLTYSGWIIQTAATSIAGRDQYEVTLAAKQLATTKV